MRSFIDVMRCLFLFAQWSVSTRRIINVYVYYIHKIIVNFDVVEFVHFVLPYPE